MAEIAVPVALTAYAVGVTLSAAGKYQEGKSAKEAHDYNARMAKQKAGFEEELANVAGAGAALGE